MVSVISLLLFGWLTLDATTRQIRLSPGSPPVPINQLICPGKGLNIPGQQTFNHHLTTNK